MIWVRFFVFFFLTPKNFFLFLSLLATAQGLSLAFSMIKMASTVMTYQRFESEHVVGRSYPWDPMRRVTNQRHTFRRSTSRIEAIRSRHASRTPTWTPQVDLNETLNGDTDSVKLSQLRRSYMGNLNIIEPTTVEPTVRRSHSEEIKQDDTLNKIDVEIDRNVTDDDKLEEIQLLPPIWERAIQNRHRNQNPADEDLIEDMSSYLRRTGQLEQKEAAVTEQVTNEDPIKFDRSPSFPPPPRPTSIFSTQQLSRVKDMLIFDAEKFIIEHVPRLPPGLFDHQRHQDIAQPAPDIVKRTATGTDGVVTTNPPDETDFILPTRKRTINGLEPDDIFGKFISFTGWILFLVMRMFALSTFSVFFLRETIYLCVGHYLVVLLCLYWEAATAPTFRFHAKLHRMTFYIFLAYIYLFCLLEFKIKFVHIKTWYIGYFFVVFTQNLLMTQYWYLTQLYYSWWFYFLYDVIIWSGVLSLACNVFYYFVLRPKEKILLVDE